MTPDASDEEAAWRDLVAQYAAPAAADGTPVPWPTREDLPGAAAREAAADLDEGPDTADLDTADGDEPDHGDAPTAPGVDPIPGMSPAPPQLRIIRPANPAPVPADDDEEHFVPPPPPPLPRLDPLTKGAWVALFGGPAYLLIAVMVDWQVPGWAAFCAVAAFVGGFATLVVHMGERPPRDSGPDDGAVV